MCREKNVEEVMEQNVEDVANLASRMLPSQVLIVPSTASVARRVGRSLFAENDPVNSAELDLYALSMLKREKALRDFASRLQGKSPLIIMLRLGTVVGGSPSQGLLLHAAMARAALLLHPQSWRPVLWLPDLERQFCFGRKGKVPLVPPRFIQFKNWAGSKRSSASRAHSNRLGNSTGRRFWLLIRFCVV